MRFDSNGVVYDLDPIIPIKHDRIYNLISLLTAYYFDCGTEQPMNECCNSILFCLLTELKNICREKDSNMRLAQIKEYVYRNYMHDISTSNIADFLFLNSSYCNTLYKKQTGETISDFITRVRIDHAAARLTYSAMPLKEIALEFGYHDVFFFSRQFKKVKGISPTEYKGKK